MRKTRKNKSAARIRTGDQSREPRFVSFDDARFLETEQEFERERTATARFSEKEAVVLDETERKRILTLRIVAVCATVLIAVMGSGLIANLVNIGRLNRERAALERELAYYEQQIELNRTLIDGKTTDQYIEDAAREELGMIYEGELIYVD